MRVAYYAIPWDEKYYRVLIVEDGVWMISDYVWNDDIPKYMAISEAITDCAWSKISPREGGWYIGSDWFTHTLQNADAISRAIISHEMEVALGGTPGTEI